MVIFGQLLSGYHDESVKMHMANWETDLCTSEDGETCGRSALPMIRHDQQQNFLLPVVDLNVMTTDRLLFRSIFDHINCDC